jgi:hypothetical protein
MKEKPFSPHTPVSIHPYSPVFLGSQKWFRMAIYGIKKIA